MECLICLQWPAACALFIRGAGLRHHLFHLRQQLRRMIWNAVLEDRLAVADIVDAGRVGYPESARQPPDLVFNVLSGQGKPQHEQPFDGIADGHVRWNENRAR